MSVSAPATESSARLSGAPRPPTPDGGNTGSPDWGNWTWETIINTLHAAGYDGHIAVEHEDPEWGGTLEKTLQGLQMAADNLRPLIAAPAVAN